MAQGKQFTCACGWSVLSPNGEEDVLKHAKEHADEYHSDLNLGMDDLRRDVKEVSMPETRSMM